MKFKKYINESKYKLVKTGGRTETRTSSFTSSEPGVYDIINTKTGKKEGELSSMRDMNYPAANVTKWVAIIFDKKTKEFQYFKKAKQYILSFK